jgi:hypothetical protein
MRMPLDINRVESVRDILTRIRFVERYADLSRRFAHSGEERSENLQKDAVMKIAMRLGYPVEHHKGDDFFQVVSEASPFRIHLNLALKHGAVELIFGVYQEDTAIAPLSGPWGVIARNAGLSNERIRLPVFRNHEDLTQILSEAFSVMEALKSELTGLRIDAKNEQRSPDHQSRTIVDERLSAALREKIDRLLAAIDQRQDGPAEFLRTASRDLENPATAADAIERLRGCYSMTQYVSFSNAEMALFEEIISLCSDATGPKHQEAVPQWVAELMDEEQKFWNSTYQRFSRDERVAHWSQVLGRGMRGQVESGLDAYATYSPEWRRKVLAVEPDIDAIMDIVFARYWKDLWSRDEYLRRIGANSEPTRTS